LLKKGYTFSTEKGEGKNGGNGGYMVLILLCVVLAVAGQLLLKQAMLTVGSPGKTPLVSYLFTLITNPYLIVGLVMYIIGFSLWLLVLARTRLGYAYLFMGLTYVLIPLSSHKIFGEEITFYQAIGMILITIGVVIVGLGK